MAKTITTIAERNIAAEDDIINLKVKVKVKVESFFLCINLKVKVGKFLSLVRNSYNSITLAS